MTTGLINHTVSFSFTGVVHQVVACSCLFVNVLMNQ